MRKVANSKLLPAFSFISLFIFVAYGASIAEEKRDSSGHLRRSKRQYWGGTHHSSSLGRPQNRPKRPDNIFDELYDTMDGSGLVLNVPEQFSPLGPREIEQAESDSDDETEYIEDTEKKYNQQLLDGDIMGLNEYNLPEFQKVSNQLEEGGELGGEVAFGGTQNFHKLWPNGQIPFLISSRYSVKGRKIIARALSEIHRTSCVRFIPRTDERDYVLIKPSDHNGGSCQSFLGRQGGSQHLILDFPACAKKRDILHEAMHTLGFYHEHSRPDRDDYITIKLNNVRAGFEKQFRKINLKKMNLLGTPYDYKSVMHYGSKHWSINGKDTIIPKQHGVVLTKNDFLSQWDIEDINRLYECYGEKTPKRKNNNRSKWNPDPYNSRQRSTTEGSVVVTIPPYHTDNSGCKPNPCRNFGTCVSSWHGFSCRCPADFTGQTCDQRLSAPPIDASLQQRLELSDYGILKYRLRAFNIDDNFLRSTSENFHLPETFPEFTTWKYTGNGDQILKLLTIIDKNNNRYLYDEHGTKKADLPDLYMDCEPLFVSVKTRQYSSVNWLYVKTGKLRTAASQNNLADFLVSFFHSASQLTYFFLDTEGQYQPPLESIWQYLPRTVKFVGLINTPLTRNGVSAVSAALNNGEVTNLQVSYGNPSWESTAYLLSEIGKNRRSELNLGLKDGIGDSFTFGKFLSLMKPLDPNIKWFWLFDFILTDGHANEVINFIAKQQYTLKHIQFFPSLSVRGDILSRVESACHRYNVRFEQESGKA